MGLHSQEMHRRRLVRRSFAQSAQRRGAVLLLCSNAVEAPNKSITTPESDLVICDSNNV